MSRVKLSLLKRLYTHITLTKPTSLFFLFTFFHCLTQGIIQSLLFTLDTPYHALFSDITLTAQIPARNHTNLLYVEGGYVLELCDYVPHDEGDCVWVFDSREGGIDGGNTNTTNTSVSMGSSTDPEINGEIIISQLTQRSFTLIAQNTSTQNQTTSQVVFEANNGAGSVNISQSCSEILLYPTQHFQNNIREEIAFMFLQFWILVLSILAMVYDSVPHVLTIFLTRILLTSWSLYSLFRTLSQQSLFQSLIASPTSPCSLSLFNTYFTTRISYEIPDIILNSSALGISAYLSWSLYRTYNAQVFTYVGAPKAITDLYKYFLALQTTLQLELFVLLTAAGLWTSQLFNSYITTISKHTPIYEALVIVYGVFIVPWLLIAWYGIRYENRTITITFISIACIFFLASSFMFISPIYRWTFYAWPCLGCFITASLILLITTVVLGSVCLRNFGKGLAQYLYASSNLSSSNFTRGVFERDVERDAVDDGGDEIGGHRQIGGRREIREIREIREKRLEEEELEEKKKKVLELVLEEEKEEEEELGREGKGGEKGEGEGGEGEGKGGEGEGDFTMRYLHYLPTLAR
ncbi:hypothetical protein F5050DRAFT_1897700 [Lentinula boryana]|uniref:Uncharacterized protein n=1 Tax=Lentinula boryana TaxID=40481 RepID=A0ABQ8Q4X1_9AGAR|nr:hypothetical protein F5050DRAFT_1897700 [Lentinula boryana]